MIKSNYTTALAAGLVSVVSIGAALPSSAQHGPRDYQRTALTAMKEGKSNSGAAECWLEGKQDSQGAWLRS